MMNSKNYRQSSCLRFDQTSLKTYWTQRLNFLIRPQNSFLMMSQKWKKKLIMALMKKKNHLKLVVRWYFGYFQVKNLQNFSNMTNFDRIIC